MNFDKYDYVAFVSEDPNERLQFRKGIGSKIDCFNLACSDRFHAIRITRSKFMTTSTQNHICLIISDKYQAKEAVEIYDAFEKLSDRIDTYTYIDGELVNFDIVCWSDKSQKIDMKPLF